MSAKVSEYAEKLQASKNIILRGAPGTGKTYLAKQIAAHIVSNGQEDEIEKLSAEDRERIGFVQFHPSYDYTDFVEGLRPVLNKDGTMEFQLKPGVFMSFVEKARDNSKPMAVVSKEHCAKEVINEFLLNVDPDTISFKTKRGKDFTIAGADEKNIFVDIPENKKSNAVKLSIDWLVQMLVSERKFEKPNDLKDFFERRGEWQEYSYYLPVYVEIKKNYDMRKTKQAEGSDTITSANKSPQSKSEGNENTAKEALDAFLDEFSGGKRLCPYKAVDQEEYEFRVISHVKEKGIIKLESKNDKKYPAPYVMYKDIIELLLIADEIKTGKDVYDHFSNKGAEKGRRYDYAIFLAAKDRVEAHEEGRVESGSPAPDVSARENKKTQTHENAKNKKYVFIIDEINRGEISNIFGELFFAIDPGYRGEAGSVSTKYANLHDDPNRKFYIPENVYIIGTMNDIDRSVDTFDFAMRRRFRFIEIKADDSLDMLDKLDATLKDEAISRMKNLNNEIAKTEGLNKNYQVGAAYFLKSDKDEDKDKLDFEELWEDYLSPLLQEYVRGMSNEKDILEKFKKAYDLKPENTGSTDGKENETDSN